MLSCNVNTIIETMYRIGTIKSTFFIDILNCFPVNSPANNAPMVKEIILIARLYTIKILFSYIL